MRATTDASLLAAALRDGVAQAKGIMPILQHARLRTVEDGIEVTTTDLEALVQTVIPATVTEHGDLCADASLLRAAMVTGGEIALEQDGMSLLVRRKPRSRVKVLALPAAEWPVPANVEWQPAGIDPLEFAAALEAVSYATLSKDVRPYCSAICIGKNFAATTDGYRFAIADINFDRSLMMIPVRGARLIRNRLGEKCSIKVGVIRGITTWVAVEQGSDRLEVKLFPDARFPDFPKYVPAETPRSEIHASRTGLRAAIERVAPFCAAKDSGTRLARMEVKGQSMLISDRDGDNHDTVEVDPTSGNFTGGINLTYLADALDVIDAARVTVAAFGEGTTLRYTVRAEGHAATHGIAGAVL
ncbi:hypothetical protein ACQQ2N_12320 [Dokdonella sp. MW10]|uniref:hypothetical protein n=1 Tax=Dokdonella sp. MW10 TaxID=2992926 RepID=UPI003F7FAD21